jgi:hypothetical protein
MPLTEKGTVIAYWCRLAGHMSQHLEENRAFMAEIIRPSVESLALLLNREMH